MRGVEGRTKGKKSHDYLEFIARLMIGTNLNPEPLDLLNYFSR